MAFKEIIDSGMGGSGELVRAAGSALVAGTVILKSVVRVPKNHKGIPTVRENPERIRGPRKGQRYKPVGSGMHLVVPFIGGIESRSMQKQPDDLPSFNVRCKDGKFNVDAAVVWYVKQSRWEAAQENTETNPNPPLTHRIKPAVYGTSARVHSWYFSEHPTGRPVPEVSEDDENLYRALFEKEKDKLDNFIRQLARTGIVAAASDLMSDELLEPNVTLPKTQELFGPILDAHGVALESMMITSFGPSEAQVHIDGIRSIFSGGSPDDGEDRQDATAQILHLFQGGGDAS